MNKDRIHRVQGRTLGSMILLASLGTGATAMAAEDEQVDHRAPLVVDFVDGAYLPSQEGIVVAGTHGLLGLLKMTAEGAELTRYADVPNEDFTALERWSDNEVLLGSSSGKVYLFDGKTVTEVGSLSEYNEPVLDIAAANGKAWAVGGRGMLAKTSDGRTWENVTIEEVTQPQLTIPAGDPGDWYFGVSNLNMDTVEFSGTVNGKPAVVDTDYALYPDEGFVQFVNTLDSAPAPTISFKFAPGPAFRAGDVSWNVVLFDGTNLTLGGEFGMVLQSGDDGQTWVRRDALVTPKEPEPPYWIAGVQDGDRLYLTGAAGVVRASQDGGVTWSQMTPPSTEGVFGVTLTADGKPVVAGAVGLVGVMEGDKWKVADRSELQLLSWLRTPVEMPDGSLVLLGGRSTTIAIKDGKFTRVAVAQK
ncbi:MAG: hypothetical protein FJ164_08740 [Gammaproteobacteria bacterium]|nr:hypothetical protein [Gammaproteobacteria bacterium]